MPRAGLDAESIAREAARIIDAEGLGELSLSRLARLFGVASPSLYKHVNGFDDLITRVTALRANELADALTEASVGLSGRQALESIARAYRSFAHEHPGTCTLIQRSPAWHSPRKNKGGRRHDAHHTVETGKARPIDEQNETYAKGSANGFRRNDDDNDNRHNAADRIVRIVSAVLVSYDISEDSLVDAVRLVRSTLHGFVDLELNGGFGLKRSVDASFSVAVALLDESLAHLSQVNLRS